MFFTYNQNNSGGGFVFDSAAGISHYVIIEADSATEADRKAESIGLYFDGYGDCDCCGDRWYSKSNPMWPENGKSTPDVYDFNPLESSHDDCFSGRGIKWIKGAEGYIHYADGRVEGFWE